MKEDLHKDEFEDFFKDTFEEKSDLANEQGWDIPSNKVWTNVEKAIKKDDDSDAAFIWWTGIRKGLLFFGILLLSAITFIVLKNNQKENLLSKKSTEIVLEKDASSDPSAINTDAPEIFESNKINKEQTVESNDKSSDQAPKVNSKSKQSEPLNQTHLDKNKATKSSKEHDTQNQGLKTKSVISKPKPNRTSTPSDVLNSNDQKIEKDSTQKDIANLTEPSSRKNLADNPDLIISSDPSNDLEKPFETLNLIPTKSTLAESLKTSKDTLAATLAFTDLNDTLNSTDTKKGGFYIGLMVAPANNFRAIKAKGSTVVPLILNRDEVAKTTFSAGINLGYKVSKNWSFETGFNYSKISIQHNRRRQVRYSTIGEQVNNSGEFEKNYNLDLSSSGGEANTDIALARDSDVPIPENDFINLRLRTENNISFGSIPLIARYQFGKGKLNFGLKAGLVNRFVLKGEVQIQSAEVMRTGLRLVLNDRFYEPRTLQNLKSYEADFLIGAGAYYHLNDKFWLSVEPTVTRSLNPIFENQNFKTFPVFRSLDIGVGYLF